jgi:transcription elongation factor GreA
MYDELTEVDIRKMQEEIKYRYEVVAPPLEAEVKRTREFGDLSENAEYKVAKQERNKNRSRIRYLENMIRTAKVIQVESKEDEVGLFDRVEYYHEERDALKRIQIVTTLRQDALGGYVSKESPLGMALMGHKVGDRVCVQVNPTRAYYVVIRSIEKGVDNEELPISSF